MLGLLLRLLNQHWGREVDAALVRAGFEDIRPTHANVFPFIPADGIQVSELATYAQMRKQSMAQAVEQLERAGYVERRPDPADRRGRLVFLTRRGAAVRPVGVAAGRDVEREWARVIGTKRLEELRDTLQELLDELADPPG
ncbi:MarR family transcriptional regulator [Mycobacterium sp. 1165196.3]|nr:MarR family transcriptional regulator [Mycobacterium sp. 1245852.3]OBK39364.1 MarR family transcriptional regulator [Mycobacterium sp. 1165196.3]